MVCLPIIKPEELIRVLKRQGFVKDRQSGSHATFIHPDNRTITIPIHRKTVGKGLLRKILRDIAISPKEFQKLLK